MMYAVTEDDVKNIGAEKWVYPNLLIEGHILIIIAEGGGGKTSIFVHLAPEFVKAGYNVKYINQDSPYADYKRYQRLAEEGGYTLIAPDVKKNGANLEGMLDLIDQISRLDTDLTGEIFIFDTLKKCVDMMHKGKIKDFFSMLRRMTARGASIVLLGHANKKRDFNNNLVYEGTGDVRNDTDELLILEYMDEGNRRISSTYVKSNSGAKVRGVFRGLSFSIDKENRGVQKLPKYVDVRNKKRAMTTLNKYADIIDFIEKFVKDNPDANQSQILNACKTEGHGKSSSREVLKLLSDPSGIDRKLVEKKSDKHPYPKTYSLVEQPEPILS